ncbi:MAG: hypothetical protein IJH08_04935 [Atopobiaceae bacterium]|nr:hypothetical protein [Atopobiaceae bacterium]
MNSIDNLRDYVLTAPSICSTTRAILVAYIDNIEREVAEVRDREYRNGMENGEMAAERDGWVRLPVDADGEPIHVGDVMDEQLPFGGYAAPAPVDTMELSRGAGGYGWMVRLDSESGAFINPKLLRHHHAPTVEDVLREFYVYAERGKEHHREDVDDAVLAEYAARLRLAGDE